MRALPFFSLVVFLLIGCGGAKYYDAAQETASQAKTEKGEMPALDDHPAEVDPKAAEKAKKSVERKIIYEGRLSIVVENFDEFEAKIPEVIEQFEGYLKEASINRREGRWRSGRWVARIPSARFDEFLAEVSGLGIAEEQEQTTDDVTMEYLDLEARIASKKKLEERIEEVLKQKGEKLADQLEGERELMRVRSEIDSMQGRLNYLKNRVDFSTVTIDAREEKDYVPKEAPDLAGRISIAWQESMRSLKIAGEGVVIAIVAFVPWIIPLALVGGLAVVGWKRIRGAASAAKKTPGGS